MVHPGDEAQIKVETVTFTRYGLLNGRVVSVSQDAIQQDEAEQAGVGQAEDAATTMQIDDMELNLGPGMAITVEIKIGKKRLIDYLLHRY